MMPADIGRLLARADRDADGSYRVIVSRAAPGRPVGRIRFEGTRSDDPNDIVPHEDRRELRAYRVFSAWLNHVDAKGINSLAALVTEDGRSFIRRYLLDFGSALGSAATGPREGWEGFEELMESHGAILRRAASFGLVIPEWRTMQWFERPSVGRLPLSHTNWDPDKWAPHIMNRAFHSMRPDDAFWAAWKLTRITDDIIGAAVAEGQFADPEGEAALARVIRERRDRILQTYLPAINPIVEPELSMNGLTFRNAAVDAGVATAPGGYQARWSRFDNATGTATPLGAVRTTSLDPAPSGDTQVIRMRTPPLNGSDFVQVEIAATSSSIEAWQQPITLHFRRGGLAGINWQLVGLVRLP